MNFKQKLLQIIRELFGEKARITDADTPEKKQQVAEKYKEVFETELLDDFNAYNDMQTKAKAYDEVLSALASDNEDDDDDTDNTTEDKTNKVDLKVVVNDLKKKNSEHEQKIKDQQDTIDKLGKQVEPDNPGIANVKIRVTGMKHSSTHLFGIEHDFYSLDKRWNKVMAKPKIAIQSEFDEEEVFPKFQAEVRKYGKSIAKRMQQLHELGLLVPNKKGALDVDYGDLTNAGLGEQFIVMRQDALIARILTLPNIYGIFPRRFGIQDRELITNAFFGEFSQAYQAGEVWKGSMDLQPELGYVDDAMFKTLFENMKWLERQYIGYLNREGSDPIKWSMIEWTILNIATVLTMEQYERRILGIYVKPIASQPGHYLHASTGFIYTLMRYIHEYKLLPFSNAGFAGYDNVDTNFVDMAISFYETIKENVPNFRETEYTMMLNENHRYWFKSQVRAKYGLQTDFDGPIDNKVPDTNLSITWVPNMKQLKFVVVTKPGNFQALENLPGEMFNIKFDPEMESVKSWSVWKEGFSASWIGKQFNSLSALTTNAYKLQEVFCNKPVSTLAADGTTADANNNFWFVTAANSGATGFTDFTNAKAGIAYILECGNTTNATNVAKSGKFSEITEAWTPTAVGDYLMVVYDTSASKFFELERCVGGTRTINVEKQPNTPGNGGR